MSGVKFLTLNKSLLMKLKITKKEKLIQKFKRNKIFPNQKFGKLSSIKKCKIYF